MRLVLFLALCAIIVALFALGIPYAVLGLSWVWWLCLTAAFLILAKCMAEGVFEGFITVTRRPKQ